MSPYRRNVMVGVTVLGAMLVLAWMILKFSGQAMRPFAPTRILVHFITDRADGLSDGALITYLGVSVGQINGVTRLPDDKLVRVEGQVDALPALPANLKGVIRSTGLLGGGSAIMLVLTGERPEGTLQPDQEIQASYIGLDILPPEFAELAADLRLTSRQFRESNVITHIDEQVQHIGTLVDSIGKFVDDPKLRKDLQDSIANIRLATEKANQIGDDFDKFTKNLDRLSTETSSTVQQANTAILKTQGHIDDLSKNVGDRLTQIAGLLQDFQSIAQKVNTGQGTAGQLINDPKFYQSLVDTTRELNATITDLKRLVQQWEQEGVSLKLSK